MAGTEIGSLYYDLDIDDSKLNSQLSSADSSVKAFGNNISQQLGGAFGGIAAGIENLVKKTALLAASGSVGLGAFVKSAADLQQTSKSFEVLTGNVDVANKLFAQLASYANNTPFEFPQIAKAGQVLLGFGIKSDDVYKRITMLGDIAASTGADFQSLALVFGQVNATGKLMGQDALQLINNNIPITSILAKDLGISVQKVKERMEDGAISADVFNKALLKTTQEGGLFFKGTDVLAQSLNGRLSTLKDTVLEFGRNLIGVKVDPKLGLVIEEGGIFDRLSKLVPRITKGLQELTPKIKEAFEFIGRNGETIKDVLIGIAAAYTTAKLAAVGFAIAAAINPFTLIAAAIVLLVGGLAFLQAKFDILGQTVQFLRPLLDGIGNVFSTFILPALQNLGNTIAQRLLPALGQMWDAIQRVWSAINPAFTEGLKYLALIIGGIIVGAIMLLIGSFNMVVNTISFVISVISNLIKWFANLVQFVGQNALQIAGYFRDLPGMILKALGDLGSLLFNAGKDLIKGMINGVKSMVGSLDDTIKGAASGAVNSMKKALGIHSPSRVFAEIGTNVGQGLVQGIKSQYNAVQTSLDGLGGNMSAVMSGPNMPMVNGGSGTSSSKTNNFGDTVINIGTVQDRSDAQYIIDTIDQNQRLQQRGVAPA